MKYLAQRVRRPVSPAAPPDHTEIHELTKAALARPANLAKVGMRTLATIASDDLRRGKPERVDATGQPGMPVAGNVRNAHPAPAMSTVSALSARAAGKTVALTAATAQRVHDAACRIGATCGAKGAGK